MYIVHTKSEPRLVEFSEQIQKENSSNFKAKTVDPIFQMDPGLQEPVKEGRGGSTVEEGEGAARAEGRRLSLF